MHRNASQPAESSSIGIIHRALDAGINFIDTADVYSQGESEVIVGKALAGGRRDGVILATKFHAPDGTTASGGWAPTGSISTRCTARIPTPTSRGPPHRTAAPRQDPGVRLLDLPGAPDRRGAVDGAAAGASQRIPARYDLSNPDNQRKLDAADALAGLAEQAGMSLIHLAPPPHHLTRHAQTAIRSRMGFYGEPSAPFGAEWRFLSVAHNLESLGETACG